MIDYSHNLIKITVAFVQTIGVDGPDGKALSANNNSNELWITRFECDKRRTRNFSRY
jgi:hypothetical protein